MNKQAVYFVETQEGERLYKLDTFWSKGDISYGVKVHNDSEYDRERFFGSLCSGFKPWDRKEDVEKLEKVRERYTNSKYGYQIVMSDEKINYIEKQELSNPVYLRLIQEINDDFTVQSVEFTPYDRDTKIDQILNED
jgi:hypothetical protein